MITKFVGKLPEALELILKKTNVVTYYFSATPFAYAKGNSS